MVRAIAQLGSEGLYQESRGSTGERLARRPDARMVPEPTASAQPMRPVASRRKVSGSVSTTLGGVPRVWVGPESPIAHCTAAYGGTLTSTERPGCCPARVPGGVRV